MRRVILVTGPPCAGKTTHVQANAQPGDRILDQDTIGARRMNQAMAQVAAMTDGTAWVIRCAPGPTARRNLAARIGATETVHLVQPEHVLVHRAAHRPHPRRHIAAVAKWFTEERADRAPHSSKVSSKAGTTMRGYGWQHQQARRKALADMHDGTPCPRCSQPMWRSQAKLLDLDHTEDRAGYQGMAHRTCNRRAGQAKATRIRNAKQQTATPRSRSW